MNTFEEAYERLVNWHKTLGRHIESSLPQVREVLAGKTDLPDGCPSRASAALMEFSKVEEDLTEVMGAVADVRRGIAAQADAE